MSVHVLVRHEVAAFDDWKTVFDDHDRVRREYGQVGYGLFCEADDERRVTILLEFEDRGRAREFSESGDLRETMERAGVVGAPEITFLTLADEKRLSRPAT